MKKDEMDELRPEYRREDLGPGVRGKYLEAYRAGTNLVLLSPDVAKVFPTEEAVNDFENFPHAKCLVSRNTAIAERSRPGGREAAPSPAPVC